MSLLTNAKKLIGYLLGYEQLIGHLEWQIENLKGKLIDSHVEREQYKQQYAFLAKGYPPPETSGNITSNEIHEVLMKVGMPRLVLPPDRECRVTTAEEYERALKLDNTEEQEYITEYFDCDDFAWQLMGRLNTGEWAAYAHGVVWTEVDVEAHEELEARGNHRVGDLSPAGLRLESRPEGTVEGVAAHALNFFIDMEHKLWFVEPQTDQILEPEWVIATQGSCQPVLLYIM